MRNAFRRQGQLDKVIAAYHEQAEILQAQEKLDNAIILYRELLDMKPDDELAMILIGNELKEQGNLSEAIIAYQKLLEVKPEHDSAWNRMGLVLYIQGKPDKAINAFREQVKVNPDHVSAHYNIGSILRKQGKLDEANAAFQRHFEMQPENVSKREDLFVQGTRHALQFNGVDNYIDIGGNSHLTDGYTLTYAAWINIQAYVNQGVILWDDDLQINGDRGLEVNASGNIVAFREEDGFGNIISDTVLALNTWYHIAFVTDENSRRLYINGKLDKEVAGRIPDHTGRTYLIIGSGHKGFRGYFHGLISEVAIFDRALTDIEIQHLMDRGPDLDKLGLIGYWRLNEGHGMRAKDISGYGNMGNLKNGPIWVTSDVPLEK